MVVERMPEEVKLVHCKCLESRLDQLTLEMTSLTERLAGKGTRQAIEYEEESVHNVLPIVQNAIMPIAKKVKQNILHMMTMHIIMPQPATLQNPVTNLICTVLKAPNALVIK